MSAGLVVAAILLKGAEAVARHKGRRIAVLATPGTGNNCLFAAVADGPIEFRAANLTGAELRQVVGRVHMRTDGSNMQPEGEDAEYIGEGSTGRFPRGRNPRCRNVPAYQASVQKNFGSAAGLMSEEGSLTTLAHIVAGLDTPHAIRVYEMDDEGEIRTDALGFCIYTYCSERLEDMESLPVIEVMHFKCLNHYVKFGVVDDTTNTTGLARVSDNVYTGKVGMGIDFALSSMYVGEATVVPYVYDLAAEMRDGCDSPIKPSKRRSGATIVCSTLDWEVELARLRANENTEVGFQPVVTRSMSKPATVALKAKYDVESMMALEAQFVVELKAIIEMISVAVEKTKSRATDGAGGGSSRGIGSGSGDSASASASGGSASASASSGDSGGDGGDKGIKISDKPSQPASSAHKPVVLARSASAPGPSKAAPTGERRICSMCAMGSSGGGHPVNKDGNLRAHKINGTNCAGKPGDVIAASGGSKPAGSASAKPAEASGAGGEAVSSASAKSALLRRAVSASARPAAGDAKQVVDALRTVVQATDDAARKAGEVEAAAKAALRPAAKYDVIAKKHLMSADMRAKQLALDAKMKQTSVTSAVQLKRNKLHAEGRVGPQTRSRARHGESQASASSDSGSSTDSDISVGKKVKAKIDADAASASATSALVAARQRAVDSAANVEKLVNNVRDAEAERSRCDAARKLAENKLEAAEARAIAEEVRPANVNMSSPSRRGAPRAAERAANRAQDVAPSSTYTNQEGGWVNSTNSRTSRTRSTTPCRARSSSRRASTSCASWTRPCATMTGSATPR